jgi:hypothetical protein
MLTIREKEASALQGAAMARFERRTIEHIRAKLSKQSARLNDADLTATIRRAAEIGNTYGLNTEREIVCIVDSMIVFDRNMFESPTHRWAWEILKSAKMTSAERAQMLLLIACKVAGV